MLPKITVHEGRASPSGTLTSAPTTQAFSNVQPLPIDEFTSTTLPSPSVHNSSRLPTCKWLLSPIVTGPLLRSHTAEHGLRLELRERAGGRAGVRQAQRGDRHTHALVMYDRSSMMLPLPMMIGLPGCEGSNHTSACSCAEMVRRRIRQNDREHAAQAAAHVCDDDRLRVHGRLRVDGHIAADVRLAADRGAGVDLELRVVVHCADATANCSRIVPRAGGAGPGVSARVLREAAPASTPVSQNRGKMRSTIRSSAPAFPVTLHEAENGAENSQEGCCIARSRGANGSLAAAVIAANHCH